MIPFDTKSPINSDRFDQIFPVLRSIRQQFKERFTLDHYMDDELNTALPNADGFHRKITMPEYIEYDNLGIASYVPTYLSGGNQLFCKKINNIIELCARKSDGVYQLTKDGSVSDGIIISSNMPPLVGETRKTAVVNGIFFAFGKKLYRSTDKGLNWTLVYETANEIDSITYANNKYVLTCVYNFAYSSDGISWTEITGPQYPYAYNYVEAVNGKFFMAQRKISAPSQYWIYMSSDAINWTSIHTSTTTGMMTDALYVMSTYIFTGTDELITSPNLSDFTVRIADSTSSLYGRIWYYNNVLFARIGKNLYKSTNATVWTIAFSNVYITDVQYEDGIYIFLYSDSSIPTQCFYTSQDLITFTKRKTLPSGEYLLYSPQIHRIENGDNIIFVVFTYAQVGSVFNLYKYRSIDKGVTWTKYDDGDTGFIQYATFVYSNVIYYVKVIAGSSDYKFCYTTKKIG